MSKMWRYTVAAGLVCASLWFHWAILSDVKNETGFDEYSTMLLLFGCVVDLSIVGLLVLVVLYARRPFRRVVAILLAVALAIGMFSLPMWLNSNQLIVDLHQRNDPANMLLGLLAPVYVICIPFCTARFYKFVDRKLASIGLSGTEEAKGKLHF